MRKFLLIISVKRWSVENIRSDVLKLLESVVMSYGFVRPMLLFEEGVFMRLIVHPIWWVIHLIVTIIRTYYSYPYENYLSLYMAFD